MKFRTISFLLASLVAPAGPAWPQGWQPNGTQLTVGRLGMIGYAALATDGAGGAYFSWLGQGEGYPATLVQRVTADGDIAEGWPSYGAVVTSHMQFASLAPDGEGGAYFLWDYDPGSRLRRMGPDGLNSAGWPYPGLLLSERSPGGASLAADPAGAALVAFTAYESTHVGDPVISMDLLAIRVLEDGTAAPGWPASGARVCGSVADERWPTVVSDDHGGMFVMWFDPSTNRILRLTATGEVAPGWPACGHPFGSRPAASVDPRLARDGQGGVYVLWFEYHGEAGIRVLLQRIQADGTSAPGWPAEGKLLATEPQGAATWLRLIVDEHANAIAVWTMRDLVSGSTISVSRVMAGGQTAPGWPEGGLRLAGGDPSAASDGKGGVYLAWNARGAREDADVFMQRITANGMIPPSWPAEGLLVCDAPGHQMAINLVSDGAGGVIAVWNDHRDDPMYHLYGIRIGPHGQIPRADPGAAAAEEFGLLGFVPNPFRGDEVRVSLTLASSQPATLELFDLAGRRVAREEVGGFGPGRHVVRLGAPRLDPGIFWVRLSQAGRVRSMRGVVVR